MHPFLRYLSVCLLVCVFPVSAAALTLQKLWTHETGVFDDSAAEIVSYDAKSQRLFVVNGSAKAVTVLDMQGNQLATLDVSAYGSPNSVAAYDGVVAVAVAADPKTDPGYVVFFDAATGRELKSVAAGALPDMVTFTPDGKYVLTANEGEPNDDYSVDPEGSITLINLRDGVAGLTEAHVRQLGFAGFNSQKDALAASGVRIFGPNASVAQDMEPEYIAVSSDSTKAWVSLQENNALAVVNLAETRIETILPLGTIDHRQAGHPLDASNEDGGISIKSWPVHGLHLPDTIASYQVNGQTYIVSANEGDSREYETYVEEERVGKLDLDAQAFPNAGELQKKSDLGRLKVTKTLGDTDGDGDFDKLYAFGTRSFSIWTTAGKRVYDSGDDFERITAERYPHGFNADNTEQQADDRSDDKGPEPEALAIGRLNERWLAFIGLERSGGIMIYDITDPNAAVFIDYVLDRDFSTEIEQAGDLGPEGMVFIPAADNPMNAPLLAVASEVSGTTTLYRIDLL